MKGFDLKSGYMTMGELITMSKELQGLRSTKLADEGTFFGVMPKQIIREGASGYLGLPELVMAEEFANIPVTLEKDYTNYQLSSVPAELKGVFNYDLNKHLIENLLDFRVNIQDDNWFNAQTEEVKARLKKSKYFMEEDGQVVKKQKALLINENMTAGDIINHINSYTTEIVFFADPQISYKLEPDGRFSNTSVFYRVDSEEEAKAIGVEKGTYIPTPWLKFVNHYNSAFNEVYIKPLREKYPNITGKDFNELPEVEEVNKLRLVQAPKYLVMTLISKIKTNLREEIEVESGGKIPTFLNTMQLKSHQFEKYFKFEKESDANFEPSMAMFKLNVPKREGNDGLDYKKQYEGIKVFKPEVTLRNSREDNRVPNLHPGDKTYSKRMKEELLNFPFKQAYITSNARGFGQAMKLSAVYEVIKNIALPIYSKLEQDSFTKENMKEFLVSTAKIDLDVLEGKVAETDGQFNGMPKVEGATPAVPTQPQAATAPPVPPVPPVPPTPQA